VGTPAVPTPGSGPQTAAFTVAAARDRIDADRARTRALPSSAARNAVAVHGRPVTKHEPTPRHTIGRFGRDPAEIARARTLVGSSLRSWGLEDEASALELAVSELVTNAFVHGHGDILVHLRADGGVVRLDVSDKGGDAPVPAVREVRSGERGGWGLLLLDELSDAWGAVTGPSETRVWMVKAASPGGATGDGDDRWVAGRDR
jgi:anti-sigma regulatory factor (Ser/Thr protein kinase)